MIAGHSPASEDVTRQRDIKLLRDTVSMLAEIVWNGTPKRGQHVWSIPVDTERDWDCILTDAIDELERLRASPAPAAGGAEKELQWMQRALAEWLKKATEQDRHSMDVHINWFIEFQKTLTKVVALLESPSQGQEER